ncbi:MAG: bifunctional phosphoribosylaminoimidazolecarboxamide formyltransferase/IMP cyclohydrolase [Aquificae bacterium]|nr:bifunctional phosphoribosylaminoimidazolecarboxamide formyltransferase/IMP cyclohydrolase [Aquificota bacterium]
MKAVLSVYDKTGLEELARALVELGYEIISSGGTAEYLKKHGIPVTEVSDFTGFPEILEGRVKTLHPKLHAAVLARPWREEDRETLKRLGTDDVTLVAVNLYPFEEKSRELTDLKELTEFIDVGGPALLRAGAKNFFKVTVLCDPADYGWVVEKLKSGTLTEHDRARLAVKAFAHTAYYDAVIYRTLARLTGHEEPLPREALPLKEGRKLRYGENPHQRGYLYLNPLEELGVARARQLQGKQMSYNNYLDADAAFRLVSEFPNETVCAIIKHANPSGVALGSSPAEAFKRAYEADPVSAFGGIVAFNAPVDAETAELIKGVFLELVLAPRFEPEALELLSKKRNLRLLEVHGLSLGLEVRKVSGGYLLQDEDAELFKELRVVTKRKPTEEELKQLLFAWKVVKHARSNAVVLAKDGVTLGVGTGNVSRVGALRCAINRARELGRSLEGAVAASEAFFPFRDSIDELARAGVTAVIQPGGSIRDEEVIKAADEHGMAVVFTGTRHFKH